MVDRLSWDDVYPLMDEVKALHPADLQVDDLSQALEREPAQVVALLDTLAELKQVQPQWAEAIEHRFYGGLTLEDAACMMAVDDCTLRRWWSGLTQCSPSGSPSC